MSLFKSLDSKIYLTAAIIYFAVFIWVGTQVPEGILRTIRLEQILGIVAITFLYFAILAKPLVNTFPHIKIVGKLLEARRSLALCTVFFALMHMFINFFYQLGGISGLFYLGPSYLLAVECGAFAFILILIFAAAPLVFKISEKYLKIINKLVYVAGFLLLIHALLLGTHFQDLSGLIPQLFYIALAVLILLEAQGFESYLVKRFKFPKRILTILLLIALSAGFIYFNFIADTASLGIHKAHEDEALYDNYMQSLHPHR